MSHRRKRSFTEHKRLLIFKVIFPDKTVYVTRKLKEKYSLGNYFYDFYITCMIKMLKEFYMCFQIS